MITTTFYAAPGAGKRPRTVSRRRIWLCSVIFLLLMPMGAPAAPAIFDDLFGVSFPSAETGWVCGRWGVMYHTTDGGKSWVSQDTGTDVTLLSVFFVDGQNGWAVGDTGTILHTGDAGMTWRKQACPVPSFYLMDVFFVSPAEGWIVTERTHILHTANGGETWQIQFQDQDYILKSVSFSDSRNGWAVGEYGFTYHTRDGGAHWRHQAGYFRQSLETGGVEAGNYLFRVIAEDAERAWAAGIDGHGVRTLDGGQTWQEVKTGAPRTQLFSVASDRSGTIVIAGKETIRVSTDDGRTWSTPSFEPPNPYGWIYRVARKGASAGFIAVGGDGMIYLSDGNNVSSTWHRATHFSQGAK
ncbi:MAG: hypothetical protein HKP58_04425 [Desulfatitalea sp.]|nr:hypothetical protein [Desulfatitalea sp.]NNJ99637.1 hypothetical protein [Desulfatitalea sp.]